MDVEKRVRRLAASFQFAKSGERVKTTKILHFRPEGLCYCVAASSSVFNFLFLDIVEVYIETL